MQPQASFSARAPSLLHPTNTPVLQHPGFRAMSSVEDLCTQIKGCAEFFTSRLRCGGPSSDENVASMARSLASQVQALSELDIPGAAALNRAVGSSGFDEPRTKLLADAIEYRLQHGPEALGRRGAQTLRQPEAYLTASDWQGLEATTRTVAQKVCLLVGRLTLLGLSNPSEATVKHLVALLAAVHCPGASAEQLHGMATDLKAAARSRVRSSTRLKHLLNYPANPRELSEAHWQSAYASEPPVHREPAKY